MSAGISRWISCDGPGVDGFGCEAEYSGDATFADLRESTARAGWVRLPATAELGNMERDYCPRCAPKPRKVIICGACRAPLARYDNGDWYAPAVLADDDAGDECWCPASMRSGTRLHVPEVSS